MMTPLLLLYALATAPDTSVGVVDAIPSQFVGEWNAEVEDCGTWNNDSRLVITAGHVVFWASEGPALAVATRGRRELALILELTGEGETWMATAQFSLSADERALADTAFPGVTLTRQRCPAAAAPGAVGDRH